MEFVGVISFAAGLISGVFVYRLASNDTKSTLGIKAEVKTVQEPRVLLPNMDFFKKKPEGTKKDDEIDPYVEGLSNIMNYTGEEVTPVESR